MSKLSILFLKTLVLFYDMRKEQRLNLTLKTKDIYCNNKRCNHKNDEKDN